MAAANEAQEAYWNDVAGRTWAALQDRIDRQIRPLGLAAMDRLAPAAGETVLDIGCGCGDTSLELARRVGPEGGVLGLDISAPMLEVARGRAEAAGAHNLAFREADAQTAALPGGRDAVFSRFGVMFFADPEAAFANLRRSLRPGGRLAFVCWRPLPENLWIHLPAEAAAGLVPPAPPPEPGTPGPFAFADPDRVRRILAEAGFTGIEISPHDEAIGGLDLEGTVGMSVWRGPLGAILRERPDLAPVLHDRVRTAVSPWLRGDAVYMPSATWLVSARNPG
ncbi:MAG: methyltransferase domain-containing protein [Phenylobacterium sp.]|uniref:class I SAM-dependent methyltransferase n=1 Tax=Phenylobacterium sp. TaxID=1871053 RepID=UPI0025E3AC71|nr:methyltransferase domain-containing protein [Phenylobacterium sp.]MCA6247811.1 methyltransferase domain-containing protein [Phenylobacterium sp.]MCA6254945.1 methyltransferase domain-containing protein [Phenylobacterium sp.]